jgi:hypothetical protein
MLAGIGMARSQRQDGKKVDWFEQKSGEIKKFGITEREKSDLGVVVQIPCGIIPCQAILLPTRLDGAFTHLAVRSQVICDFNF